MHRWIRAVTPQRREWVSKRNCALAPAQLAVFFAMLGASSLAIATLWALQGAWIVVPFAGIEAVALGAAYLAYARHAADFDRVVIEPGLILAEAASGSTTHRFQCSPIAAARVEYDGGRRALVKLTGRGDAIEVGRFLLDADRADLARELRATLARG